MIGNLNYYRLPDGTEVCASNNFPGFWVFFARKASLDALPLYVCALESRSLQRVVTVDPFGGWTLVLTDLTLDDLEPLDAFLP